MTPTWSCDISLVIPSNQRVLFLPTEKGWELPRFIIYSISSKLHLLQRAIRERFGVEMTVLMWRESRYDEEKYIASLVWLMENHTPDWTPPADSRWIDADELQTLPLANEN